MDTGAWATPACWRFAHVRYDETRALLWVHGREVALDRSGLALLSYFLRHAGEVVHKDTLLEIGWSGRIVAENTLAKAISRLRHALDDEAGQLLRVAHGYGYRLAAQVERDEPAQAANGATDTIAAAVPVPAAQPFNTTSRRIFDAVMMLAVLAIVGAGFVRLPPRTAAMAAAARVPASGSIAILPFADLSPKRDQAYFADGLAEELLDNLARLSQLRVASRTSSFAYRDKQVGLPAIGRALNVNTVLEGSVRTSGDRVRVTVQLIDARDGFHLWSQTYDRPMSELFAMQDEIVGRIVEALQIELGPEEVRAVARHGTGNPEAFRQFLLARSLFDHDETAGRRALVAYRRAVALDPQFFEAWLGLAMGLDYDSVFPDSTEEVVANKREALTILQRLIRMRPQQADLYLKRGDMLFWHWWDMPATERDYEQAARLGLREDNDWMIKMSRLYAATGRMPEAMDMTAKAAARVPASASVVRAYHLLSTGRFDESRAAAQEVLRRYPLDEHAHYYLGLSDLLQGRAAAAEAHFDDSTDTFRLAGMAMAEHTLGHRAASEQHLQRLAERYGHVAPYLVADVHAWRGENDAAFAWMQRSVDARDGSLMYLAFDPLIAPLRKDARWPGLLRQVGLDGYLPTATTSR